MKEETALSVGLGPSDKGPYKWVLFFPCGWQRPHQLPSAPPVAKGFKELLGLGREKSKTKTMSPSR